MCFCFKNSKKGSCKKSGCRCSCRCKLASFIPLGIALLALSALFALFFMDYYIFKAQHHNGLITLTTALVFFTGLIAWVAHTRLQRLERISESDLLLRIDKRYGSEEIIRARSIIANLRFDVRKSGEEAGSERELEMVSKALHKMRIEGDNKDNQYTYLLALLDFLETISYFEHSERITQRAIEQLLGSSIYSYGRIFKPWVEDFKNLGNASEITYGGFQGLWKKMYGDTSW